MKFHLFQPVKSEQVYEGDNKWKVVSYEKTPIMSTYLLAFVVGEFDYVEGKDADGVLVRVYTPVGKKEEGKYALDVRRNYNVTFRNSNLKYIKKNKNI